MACVSVHEFSADLFCTDFGNKDAREQGPTPSSDSTIKCSKLANKRVAAESDFGAAHQLTWFAKITMGGSRQN